MCKARRMLQVGVLSICLVAVYIFASWNLCEDIQIEEEPIALVDSLGTLIQETEADVNVIPDKYNTGASGNLIKAKLGQKIEDIQFVSGSGGTINAINFKYHNSNICEEVYISNYDFSDYPLALYDACGLKNKVHITFENCMFKSVSTPKTNSDVFLEFKNCTFNSFYGSNASFERCLFGNSCYDGMVAFQNVSVRDSFFCNLFSYESANTGTHSDGIQIYGSNDAEAKDIAFVNCRFEIPPVETNYGNSYVNSCIMLALEYNNASNVNFKNCIANGGGYTIYAGSVNGYSMENIEFCNIQIGAAKRYETFYYNLSNSVKIDDVGLINKLYIGSVWKQNGETHCSVSNDTSRDRELTIYADGNIYTYVIPACPSGKNPYMKYEQYPFDVDISVPQDCSYLVCFDTTSNSTCEQIRYCNWTDKNVYMDDEIAKMLHTDVEDSILLSGKCGEKVYYELQNSGRLVVKGEGAMYNYSSGNAAPWNKYSDTIQEIVIEGNVTSIGRQAFITCDGVEKVTIGQAIQTIEGNAFMGCSCLVEINLPESVMEIGDYAFAGTTLRKVIYSGTEEMWDDVSIGMYNDMLIEHIYFSPNEIVFQESAGNSYTKTNKTIVLEGRCGEDVYYELTSDGTLTLKGTGGTYNYNSGNRAPWFGKRADIKQVIIEEGITELGAQLISFCEKVEMVKLPTTLVVIGGNVFIGCGQLEYIELPNNIRKIGEYAFWGTGLNKCVFLGSESVWKNIQILGKNNKLIQAVVFN